MKTHFIKEPALLFGSLKTSCLLICHLLFVYAVFGQNKTGINEDSQINKFRATSTSIEPLYFIIKTDPSKARVDGSMQIVRALSASTYIVKGRPASDVVAAADFVTEANDLWKLSPLLLQEVPGLHDKEIPFLISAVNIQQLLTDVERGRLPVKLQQVFEKYQTAVISCKGSFLLNEILPRRDVLFADLFTAARPELLLIGYNRRLHQINRLQHEWPEVNGKGISIGIKEQKMNEADIDLLKRVQPSAIASSVTEEHANIVATLAGGAGNSFYTGKGVAWQCSFYPSSFANLFPDDAQVLAQNNVWVQNHSYGTIVQNFYGAEARAYDGQTGQNKNLLHVFASGNKGQEAPTQGTYSGLNGFANLTGNFKMAKNVVTVAATDTAGNVAPFSSAGPLFDGRIGPQIAALGASGSSDAAAMVSGAVALLQQVYRDTNNQALPAASLIKSILYNSADDIGNKGIDYRSGFGSLNIFNAVQLMRQKKYDAGMVTQAQTWVKNISLPAQVGQYKITLSWTDTAASLNTYKSLANDLDLQLIELSTGKIYQPWCLNHFAAADSLNQLPHRGRDSLNTAEQVTVALPMVGNYQLRITGKEIVTSYAQPFHIAYSWDTLGSFTFTSPVNASDVDRDEDPNLSISWESVEADTNKLGQLLVSYNNGGTWKTISNAVKLSAGKYSWPLPDTATRAKFRMDIGTGSFYSREFMLAPLTKLTVGSLCADSVQLLWNKHIYATAYQLFALTDSAYLKPIALPTDTIIRLARSVGSSQVFAVQPITNNGLFASRSYAIDVSRQGVNCFYKTLLAENKGNEIELMLELSTTAQIDSIVFEKLDKNGLLIKTISRVAVTNGLLQYAALDVQPLPGINYYRASLQLKNGSRIVTETVLVLSNGNKLLYLYPNPVSPGRPVFFQLNTFSQGLQLQVADVQGRQVKIQAIGAAGNIDTHNLAPGIYLVTILKDGQRLETGKLLISN